MTQLAPQTTRARATKIRHLVWACSASTACLGLGGCMVVGYSSRGGFFVWPHGIGLLILLAVLYLLLRRR